MAETVVVDLNVDSGNVGEGAATLKKQLREATLEAQKLAAQGKENTAEFLEATKRAAALKEQIADVNDTINAMHPEMVFNSVVGIAQGIAGGFAAAQGAMALFGAESENVQKALLKVQAAMAIAQGLNDIKGLADSFKNFGLVLKSTAVYTKLASVAQAVYNSVVSAGSVAMKAFRVALISTGIGAIIALIGSVIAYWKEWTGWVERNSATLMKWGKIILIATSAPIQFFYKLGLAIEYLGTKFDFVSNAIDFVASKFSFLSTKIREMLEMVGILDTAEEESSEKRMEVSKKREAQIKNEIELMKARGATDEQLAQKEIELANEKLEAYKQYIEARKSAGRNITDEEKQQLDDLRNSNLIAIENLRKAQDDARKKEDEERKKAYDKWKQEEERRKQEQAKILQELTDIKIQNIQDEQTRELAEINEGFNRKLAAIKGNSANEIELRKELEIQRKTQIDELNARFEEEDRQKEAEKLKLKFENEAAALEANRIQAELKRQETKAIEKQQADLELLQSLSDTELSNEQKLLAQAQYDAKLKALDDKAKQEQIDAEARLKDAKTAILNGTYQTLSNLSELAIRDGKKQEGVRKALALVQIGIDTATALGSALATSSAPTPDNVATGGIAGIAKYITLAASITGNALKAKNLIGGGGGNIPSPSGGLNTSAPQSQVPQQPISLTPNVNKLGQQPIEVNVKASVLETDMTKTQDKIAKIEDDATF